MRMLTTMALTALAAPVLADGLPPVTVQKTPSCQCCSAWATHLEQHGLAVEVQDVAYEELLRTKRAIGLEPELSSCHTAMVDGYVVEGHVPASDILRLLEERPEALGLTVPGMPLGSPGMEMGGEVEPYEVLLLEPDASTSVYSRHP